MDTCLKKIKCEEKVLIRKNKEVSNDVKSLLDKRENISASSAMAASLDSALYEDVIKKYENLQADTKKAIQRTKDEFFQWMKLVRKQKAIALLDEPKIISPECVFVSKFTPRSRNRIHREKVDYVASCVRVGGEYAVAMRRGRKDRSIFIDSVFPLQSRDGFILDRSYPLVGFEDDVSGNTHAVFLTGLALGAKSPEIVSVTESCQGLHDITLKGYRVAKVPVLCLFDTPDVISSTEFIKDEENSVFVPPSQPMDEQEFAFLINAMDTELENQKIADASPAVEQKVYVYNSGVGQDRPLFSLAPNGIDNSWCNMNSLTERKDGVDIQYMNDISCFSDCVDISVHPWEKFNCCLTIESGRKLLLGASSTPLDAIKHDNSNGGKVITSSQELCAHDKLVSLFEKAKFEDSKNPRPPLLKIEERDEEEAEKCIETEAAVKSTYMKDQLMLEREAVPFLQSLICSSLKWEEGKAQQCFAQKKLELSLRELEENKVQHSTMWSTRSVETARALLMDEAYGASVAHQISRSIINSGVFGGMCTREDGYQGQRKYMSGLKMVNVSAIKQDDERDIDNALKEWIKSKLLPVPSFIAKGAAKRKNHFPTDEGHRSRKKDGHVGIIPPSFIVTPRINTGCLAENFADSFGGALCGLKNATHVFRKVCSAATELNERLFADGPFRKFDGCPELECILLDRVKAEEVEEANISVLEYESMRFGKVIQSFNVNSYSWNIENSEDGAIKTAINATALKRAYEEYHAFRMLVSIYTFDMLRKELEGNTSRRNTTLAVVLNWYCTVMARNRICDAFRYIAKPTSNEGLYRHFYENFTKNKIVVSIISNKIVDSLRWIMNTDVSFLKGQHSMPWETLANFVFPSLKIIDGPTINQMSVRIPPHVVGPVFVCVNFREIGLDQVEYGKLFINTVTGNGLLTVSPKYADVPEGGEIKSVFANVAHDLLVSESSDANNRIYKEGNGLFDTWTCQSASNAVTASSVTKKPWVYIEQFRNMWRCGFVIPKKLCKTIYKNRASAIIVASPFKNSKITSTIADTCLYQRSTRVEKVCKSLFMFSKGSSDILAKNLAASSLTKINVEIRHCSKKEPIATFLMIHKACETQCHDNYYSHAFFNFECKKVETREREEKSTKVDSRIFDSLSRTGRRLHALSKRHASTITSYHKKMKK